MTTKKIDWGHHFELNMSLFPIFQGTLVLLSLVLFILRPSLIASVVFIFSVYILPLIVSRIIGFFFPVREGRYPIGRYGVEGWVLQLKIQMFLANCSFFERALHLIPGLYSVWLRCWGSHIGRGVMWTPHVDILDRGLLDIGDGVLVGHKTILSCHAVFMENGEHLVYCKKMKIGTRTLIGGDSILGPGVQIGSDCQLNVSSRIYPNQIIPDGTNYDQRKIKH